MTEAVTVVEAFAMMEMIEVVAVPESKRQPEGEETAASPEPARVPPAPRRRRDPARAPTVTIVRSPVVVRRVIGRRIIRLNRRRYVGNRCSLVRGHHSLRRGNGLRGIGPRSIAGGCRGLGGGCGLGGSLWHRRLCRTGLALVGLSGRVIGFREIRLLVEQARIRVNPSFALSGSLVLSALRSYQARISPAVWATNLLLEANWPARLMAETASGIWPRRAST